MKKPNLRVTKWLGEIPVEGECAFCVSVRFQVKPISHRPNREEYQRSLQRQFDAHVKNVHQLEAGDEHSSAPGPSNRS
jgi:hypothetical protein